MYRQGPSFHTDDFTHVMQPWLGCRACRSSRVIIALLRECALLLPYLGSSGSLTFQDCFKIPGAQRGQQSSHLYIHLIGQAVPKIARLDGCLDHK